MARTSRRGEDTARHRPRWWHSPTALVVSAVCWIGALTITGMPADGYPKWWYLVWFWFLWNGLKTLLLVPFSLYWLIKAKITTLVARHRSQSACTQARSIADGITPATAYESFATNR